MNSTNPPAIDHAGPHEVSCMDKGLACYTELVAEYSFQCLLSRQAAAKRKNLEKAEDTPKFTTDIGQRGMKNFIQVEVPHTDTWEKECSVL